MEFNGVIQKFKGKKILVIGDIMLDEYIWGNVDRISPEAPVPIIEVTKESQNPGGAANVACNIYCLKGSPLLVGVVGDDNAGKRLKEILREKKMDISGIFVDSTRPTTVKTRLVVETLHQQIARIDREKKHPISKKVVNNIIGFVNSVKAEFDAVLFEDYDKGTLDSRIIKKIICAVPDKIITADPKFEHFFEYEGVTLFKPNRREIEFALGVKLSSKNIKEIGQKLKERLKCKSVLITLGKDGMALFDSKGKHMISTKAREVYDETAAGDAAIAGATMALAAGASFLEAAYIANFTAGIEVNKFGAVPVTYDELSQAVGMGFSK
ncbi:MAG: PfkB family carbohydrate kinase [bacterium]|nr:PfkB family carbohydrate kinase [bacterium]